MKLKQLTLICFAALTAISGHAAQNATVKGISEYVYPANAPKSAETLVYMPGGKEYARLSDDHRTIDIYNVRTGAKTSTIFNVADTREVETLGSIEGFKLSPDAAKILVWTDRQMVYRRSSTAKYYVYEVRTQLLRPLSRVHKRQQIPAFSPNGRMVAFVADNNIYIKKIDYDSEVAVTEDGAPGKIINGATDWTYEEEFELTSSLAWSADNETLCYLRFDESEVPEYTLPIYEGACEPDHQYALYPGEMSYKYPVAGKPNSKVTLHSYDIDTRKVTNINLPDANIEYIARIDFADNRLMACALNRDQNQMDIYSIDPRTTITKSIYTEKSKAWITPETYEQVSYESDGFVVLTNASGRMKAVKYSYSGAKLGDMAGGADYDVTAWYGRDAAGNRYYQAARPTPMDRTVWSINAKGVETCISATSGANSFTFSPDMSVAVYNHNDTKTPPVYTLVDARGKNVRTIEDNADYVRMTASLNVGREFITIPSDGRQLNAWIMRPLGFDATKKYPVVMTQYSGPGSQSVLDRWVMDWYQYFARNGFIVVCVDGRGTANRGNDFMYCVYGDLGHYETIDQTNAARYVATMPGVDASRIGICGWSYGGYEALMCATDANTPFAATVAVAPVTSWRYYDTVYTERYMMTPQQNDEGYNRSAPVNRTSSLSGNVLIMTGTADDNVHPANTYEFVARLQKDGNFCDMLVFPNKNHSIYGCGARAVVYGKMFDYFKKNL